MNIRLLLLNLLLLFLFLSSCQKEPFFRGTIEKHTFADKEIIKISGKRLNLEGNYTGGLMIVGTELIFNSRKFGDYDAYVFNYETGVPIGKLFPKGNGPSEYPGIIVYTWQTIQKADSSLCIWIYNSIDQYQLINLTNSLISGTTVIDSIIPYKYIEHGSVFYGKTFFNEHQIIGRMQSTYNDSKTFTPTYYRIYNGIPNDTNFVDITIYNPQSYHSNQGYVGFFDSMDTYNPSQNKIAQALIMVPQLNIIDINDGTIKGFIFDENKDINSIITKKESKTYYISIASSSECIYALFLDGYSNYSQSPQSNIIHVFDWNGNPVKQYELDIPIAEIGYDIVNNVLYGSDNNDGYYTYKI